MTTSFITRAHDFAVVLIADVRLASGESALDHAAAVAAIAAEFDHSDELQAACYLLYAVDSLNKPLEVLTKNFGESVARLTVETRQLIELHARSRKTTDDGVVAKSQLENIRKMLLAFGRDLRVVLLHLSSRLQTLRFYAATKANPSLDLARETLDVFAPLANRLGMGQMKWELEDLSFRFLEPQTYQHIASLLEEKRSDRIAKTQALRLQLAAQLQAQKIPCTVDARPKHIYSIVKKMRGKNLPFERVFDVRAMRVLVDSVNDCYAALAFIHTRFSPITEEYDDYIAKPKSNGYQSLHTVVRDDFAGGEHRPLEIQIRTHQMHEHAEQGVAAHWAYKEAGAKGYSGVQASGDYDRKIAMLRALLAWEREVAGDQRDQLDQATGAAVATALLQDRIYVLTPEAAIIDLPQGATPVDFAYQLHSSLGHRCRGATVDGVLVPLNTKLQSGQTVAIHAAKEGGPSRDWLNPELGFMASARGRAKVRAWFNAQDAEQTIARGREQVEKLLQREGKTALKLDDLAVQLGFKTASDLFESVGKDEFSLRTIEVHLRPAAEVLAPDDYFIYKKSRAKKQSTDKSGVLVVGMDSLMTQLAKCCKPAPPDAICGFVTRGKGVSIHRADCSNFMQIAARSSDRVIDVSWGHSALGGAKQDKGFQPIYPVDVSVQASDRNGLLRDVSEVFSAAKMNVVGVQTQSVKGSAGATAWMTFTVEVADASKLTPVMATIRKVAGVRSCRRR
ncbi:MAG: RelA/SpoT family protein [Cytophagales bacterium]|nr:RelA/SpoT family protein [Cytophagales bacterium]